MKAVTVRVKGYKGDLIIVHNHPNDARVSCKDILTMYENKNISAIVAVGHDGSVQIVSNLNREIPIDRLWEKVYDDSVIQYEDRKIAEHHATTVLYVLGIFKTEIMDKELYLVMDDTMDIGKEPLQFKSEQDKKIHDELLKKHKKEFGI